MGPAAHLDAHKLKVTTEGGGITVTFKVASPNPEEVMGLMHLALAGKARVYLRPLQYEMAPPEKTEALDQEDQVGIGSQFDAVEGCGCHAVDGEDHNMMVCDKHFREGIAEARRLFPDWPEDDLVTEGRRIALYGLPPATD